MRVTTAALLLGLASAAAFVTLRGEGFAEFGLFDHALGDPLPTGAPGRSEWDAEQLPTFYPVVPGFVGTLPPDPGFRTAKAPDGSECRCPVPHPRNFRDPGRDTVCVKGTGQAFSNACLAACYGHSADQVYACKPRWALYRRG